MVEDFEAVLEEYPELREIQAAMRRGIRKHAPKRDLARVQRAARMMLDGKAHLAMSLEAYQAITCKRLSDYHAIERIERTLAVLALMEKLFREEIPGALPPAD